MEKILNSFFDTADAAELAAFDSELAHITETCQADDTDAVLSAAFEKAGMRPKLVKTKKRKSRRLFVLVAAAVVILSAVGFTVFFDKLDVYFGISDKGSPFAGEFYKRTAEAENEDVKLVVDGVFSDEVRSYVMVSMYGKTKQGRQYVYNAEHIYDGDGDSKLKEALNSYREEHPDAADTHFSYVLQLEGEQKPGFGSGGETYTGFNTASAFYTSVSFENSELDLSKPVKIVEVQTGLSVEVDVSVNIESVRLVSDEDECFHNVVLSPMAVYVRYDSRDGKSPSSVYGERTAQLSNGETIELGLEGLQAGFIGDREESAQRSYSNLTFRKPTSIEDVVSVTINGIKYYKENTKS